MDRPQRLPVCVGLKTYPVRESDGKLQVDLTHRGGYGVTQAAVIHTFRVVSNQNVATFIKELVLEPARGSRVAGLPTGRIPADGHPGLCRALTSVMLKSQQPYAAIWQAQGIYNLTQPILPRPGEIIRWPPTRPLTGPEIQCAPGDTAARGELRCRNRLVLCLWPQAG